ncbi:hypothetical protein Btru_048842 [Bulinus truncatus]|nr:hypothetical protein Btru_048842 [Bulinus truncatus]
MRLKGKMEEKIFCCKELDKAKMYKSRPSNSDKTSRLTSLHESERAQFSDLLNNDTAVVCGIIVAPIWYGGLGGRGQGPQEQLPDNPLTDCTQNLQRLLQK